MTDNDHRKDTPCPRSAAPASPASADAWLDRARRLESMGYASLLVPDGLRHVLEPFAALAAACGGEVTINNVVPHHLDMVLLVLERMKVKFELSDGTMTVYPSATSRSRYISAAVSSSSISSSLTSSSMLLTPVWLGAMSSPMYGSVPII